MYDTKFYETIMMHLPCNIDSCTIVHEKGTEALIDLDVNLTFMI